MTEKKGLHPLSGPNPAQQSAVETTDASRMSDRYFREAMRGNPMGRRPMYIDVPAVDLQEMMNKVIKAQEAFRRIPAKIRNKFNNNPISLIAYLQDPSNRREGVEMGLIDDPVLKRQIEQEESAAKAARRRVQQERLFPRGPEDTQDPFESEEERAHKADPEANPRPQKRQKPGEAG